MLVASVRKRPGPSYSGTLLYLWEEGMLHLQGAERLETKNPNLVSWGASEGSDHSWEHDDLHILWPGLLLLMEASGFKEAPLSPPL